MMRSSSTGVLPSSQACTSSTGRPKACARRASSPSKPRSRRWLRSARPCCAVMPCASRACPVCSAMSVLPSCLLGRRAARLRLVGDSDLVAEVLNLLDERLRLDDLLVVVNVGGLAVEGHVGAMDAGRQLQRLLDVHGARLAVHALDVKLGLHLSPSLAQA